MKTYSQNNLL